MSTAGAKIEQIYKSTMVTPFALLRRSLPRTTYVPHPPMTFFTPIKLAITAGLQRLDLSRDPRKVVARVRGWKPTVASVLQLSIMLFTWIVMLWAMTTPPFPFKLGIPLAWLAAVAIPLTSQFVWPATPVLTWVLLFFGNRFIPNESRPTIHVALLPALESALYGANISDLQTRFTHPLLDVLAWLPYGILHFTIPVVVAIILWLFGPRGSLQYWAKAFGFMNLFGVWIQIILPCSAPWYEIIQGLTPAHYGMPGSPGGLLRIDRVFNSQGYTNTFGNSPLVFGAFPSLHSGTAVMEALFLSHFFPFLKPLYWTYTGILWWATMYLSHHYLIDLMGGACLTVVCFYIFMPAEFKDSDCIKWPSNSEYEMVADPNGTTADVDFDEEIRRLEEDDHATALADEGDEESRIGTTGGPNKPRTKRSVSWGETRVIGEGSQRA